VVNKTTDYNFSPQNQGADDEKDSDSNPLTGVMPEETLESGEVNLTYDAGLYPSINLQIEKTFISATPQADGSFNVNYTIQVSNSGGSGLYDLTDNQGFDTDVLINNASYTSNAPGNPGSNLFGTGTWILANDQPISANGTHTYNLLVNVRLNLNDNIGNNIYQPCLTQNPSSGNGLYNQAKVYVNDILKDQDDACGDLPNITMIKDFVNVIPQANGSYNVLYRITVGNNGGATGSYSLKDIPQFDDDVVINSGSYSGQASGAMNTSGYTTLANNVSLVAGGSHIYNVTFNVTLDLNPGSGQGGNNVYTACSVFGNGPGSGPGQGLYNKAELDRTGDGITDITDDACGDLPNITMIKDFVNVTPQANGSYNVLYRITVGNNGGATGSYSLKDIPQFDDDVVINSGSYSGQASGAMNTSGYTTLANNVSLAAGGSHIYNVTFNVTLDLNPGSGQGGNNVYTACSVFGNGPGSGPGQGLYNKAELDRTGDGITDITDDACGDLPNITMIKDFVNVTPQANGSYNVLYRITVGNNGGAAGSYSLKDIPQFDDDVVINSGSYSGQASGAMNTSGYTTLANNVSLVAGGSHIYNVTFNVTLDLNPGSGQGGNNVYTACSVFGNGPGSGPGQGLYNKAEVDRTGDGITDITDDACGDITKHHNGQRLCECDTKGNGSYNVLYRITVGNNGGATGSYSLKDIPHYLTMM
jgi:hypothetical protein